MDQGVLGIWDGHDAGVALVAGGCLVFALSEERPARRKRASGWPWRALNACLEYARKHRIGIAEVAIAGKYGRLPLRWLEPLYRRRDPHGDPLCWENRAVAFYENRMASLWGLRELECKLGLFPARARLWPKFVAKLRCVPHHDAHAFAALFGPRGKRTCVVTWDAYGEGVSLTLRTLQGHCPIVVRGPDAGLAALYGAVTVALGFREGEEGKVMALAARGDSGQAKGRFLALFDLLGNGPKLRVPLTRHVVQEAIKGLSREDIAAGLQAATEDMVLGWLEKVLALLRPDVLLLAGGLFANVRLNGLLANLTGLEGIFVFPAMGDAGLCAGAAHRVWWERTGTLADPISSVALGVDHGEVGGPGSKRVDGDLASDVAREVLAGKVVCLFRGRDEFGPRALGNRSILFRADRMDLAHKVNMALRREDFMPFAPVVTEAEASKAFGGPWRKMDLRFMTFAVPASTYFREACPAAVHVDGTCRPQVVNENSDPLLFRVLHEVRRLGGPPALVNTSFNLHREPIVHTPQDALKTFREAGLDVLYIGQHKVEKSGVEGGI